MNRNEVAVQVAQHTAVRTNFFERPQPREYEVGIVEDGASYWVYWSSERASIRSESSFAVEADALAEFLDLLDLEQQRRALFGGR